MVPMYAIFHVAANYAQTGNWPQAFQKQRYLYRVANYGIQAKHNANPDNFFDRRHYCWTSDPQCGLEIGPKRPWEDLKNPQKNLAEKLQRDTAGNVLAKQSGGVRGM